METTNLKSLLKTGIFGQMESGRFFVITDDVIIYKDGGWDRISHFDDNLICRYVNSDLICEIVKVIFKKISCYSFDNAECIVKNNLSDAFFWIREDYEKEKEMDSQHSDYISNKTVAKFVEGKLAEEKPKKTFFKKECEKAHQQLKAEAMQRHLDLIDIAFEALKEEPKKQTPTPTLGEVVSLVDSMRKIMIERQNPATDEAIAKMAKTIYKQFGYELPEIEGE